MLKPFFTFFGGKYRVASYYPDPLHDVIVEPFAGSAGYSVRYAHKKIKLFDVDPVIIGTWKYLLGVSYNEIMSLPDLDDGQSVDDINVCQEARWLIGWWLNKGSSGPRKTPSKWMREGIRPNSFWGDAIRCRIAQQLEYIRHWQVYEGSYESALNTEATWFIDPPYQIAGKAYKFKNINYSDLAAWCRSREGQVIVCENEGADWLPFREWRDIKANPSSRGGRVSREVIWTNNCERKWKQLTINVV